MKQTADPDNKCKVILDRMLQCERNTVKLNCVNNLMVGCIFYLFTICDDEVVVNLIRVCLIFL